VLALIDMSSQKNNTEKNSPNNPDMGILFPIYLLSSLWGWILTFVSFVTHMLIVMSIKPIPSQDPEKRSIQLARLVSCIGLPLIGVKLSVVGREHLPKDRPFIIVANHQSYLDIIVMLVAIPQKIVFVAKEELLNIPVLGWDIRSQGHIAINRSQGIKAARQLKEIAEATHKGKSLLLFPEGTRSIDGKVGLFKRGAFQLALDADVPIISCSIKGSGYCMPKKGFWIRPGKIQITLHPPILPETLDGTSREKTIYLSERTKAEIVSGL
jgi:1-acyl-sn-glycerol-3-phosphate acyltransferase